MEQIIRSIQKEKSRMTFSGVITSGTSDIIKREYDQQNGLSEIHGGLCKGLCKNFIAQCPTSGVRYASGQARCTTCGVFLTPEGIIKNGKNRCKCCNFQVRTRPRNSHAKQQYNKQVENLNQKQDISETSKPTEEFEEPVPEKKSTPIYEEPDDSVKTYYEFKEFLDSIKLQANYQLVMLKELLEYGELHKGEIAESLAYFNNKNTTDIEQVKYFLNVPVYDVLLKHEFIQEKAGFLSTPYYSINVKLEDFQRIELIDYFTNEISRYNEENGIPENEFPNANNMGNIDWVNFDFRKKKIELKNNPNFVTESDTKSESHTESDPLISEPIQKQTPQNSETILSVKKDSQGIKLSELQEIKSKIIKHGDILSNDELMENFGVGNMGGIRYSRKNNILILCNTDSNDFNDVIDDVSGLITYTGEGREGDQELTKGNSRIVHSNDTIILFFKEKPQETGARKRGALDNLYEFIGEVKYLKYYWKDEPGTDGKIRKVIKFVLEVQS